MGWIKTHSLLLKNHDKVQKESFFNAQKQPKRFEKNITKNDDVSEPASVVDFLPQRNVEQFQ